MKSSIKMAMFGVLGVAAGTGIWALVRPAPSAGAWDTGREAVPREITIPTYPYGEGVELEIAGDHGEPLTIQEIYQRVNPAVVTVML